MEQGRDGIRRETTWSEAVLQRSGFSEEVDGEWRNGNTTWLQWAEGNARPCMCRSLFLPHKIREGIQSIGGKGKKLRATDSRGQPLPHPQASAPLAACFSEW